MLKSLMVVCTPSSELLKLPVDDVKLSTAVPIPTRKVSTGEMAAMEPPIRDEVFA